MQRNLKDFKGKEAIFMCKGEREVVKLLNNFGVEIWIPLRCFQTHLEEISSFIQN
jgi:hypothetical protein